MKIGRALVLVYVMPMLLIASPLAAGGVYNDIQLSDPQQERSAKILMDSIRCVVCQGQSIADSNAEIAADMRGLIRERIAAGEKPEAVRAWLIEHYGDWVSFKPVLTGRSAPLWAVPVLMLVFGVWLARARFRRKGK